MWNVEPLFQGVFDCVIVIFIFDVFLFFFRNRVGNSVTRPAGNSKRAHNVIAESQGSGIGGKFWTRRSHVPRQAQETGVVWY